MLANKFGSKIKENTFIFCDDLEGYIALYAWSDGFAYRASQELFKQPITLQEATFFVDENYDVKDKHQEFYYFTNTEVNNSFKQLEIRELLENDQALFDTFMNTFDSKDAELAQITLEDIHVIGGFIGNELVGVSSILDLNGAYDVGIIVHPSYRSKGIGKELVSANTNWAIQNQHLCLYRCDAENIGSCKIAESLGFTKEVDIWIYKL